MGVPRIVHKTFTIEPKTIDAAAGIFEAWITTEDVDRDGDIVEAAGARIENYLRNPIVLFGHEYSDPEAVVGRALEITVKAGKGILARWEFAPLGTSEGADTVRRLWSGGVLNAVSIGFRAFKSDPIKDDDGKRIGRRFTDWELYEFSIIPVPSNPGALRLGKSVKETFDRDLEGKSFDRDLGRWRYLEFPPILRRFAEFQMFGEVLGFREAPRAWRVAAKRATYIPIAVAHADVVKSRANGIAWRINGIPLVIIGITEHPERNVRTFLHELLHFTRGGVADLQIKNGRVLSARYIPQDKGSLERRIEARALSLSRDLQEYRRIHLSTLPRPESVRIGASSFEERAELNRALRRELVDSIPKGFAL